MEELFDIDGRSLERFLRSWYGPPDQAAAIAPAAGRLPAPLRAWYAAAGSYSAPITFHNKLLEPDGVEERDGKYVFWMENQSVYEWAYDPDGDDALVFERSTTEGEPWHPTGVQLLAFLVSVAAFEAVMGADLVIHGENLTGGQVDALLAPLRPLPMPGPTAGAQLYAGDGLLAFSGRFDHGEHGMTLAAPWWVYLAASGAQRLTYARVVLGTATT
jgi:hypothetical protein